MTTRHDHDLRIEAGFASEPGRREGNEDYLGLCLGGPGARASRDIVAAIADGVGGHRGGREAAETTVRAFIDGYYNLPETLGVQRAAARALDAVNGWIAAQARTDPELSGMGTTFTALILARRTGYVVHVGDSRLYHLSAGELRLVTTDHTLGGDLAHGLHRAVGFEDSIRIDHARLALRAHDRFLLCTDGVHGPLREARLRELLGARASPQETALSLVDAALAAGGSDNASALVIDVVDLPPADEMSLSSAIAELPIGKLPALGELVDDFALQDILSDGRYSRLYRAVDQHDGRSVVVKFPKPRVAEEASYRRAFVSEAWVATRVRSPWIGEVIELAPGRQTRLYSVMPFYEGETLEHRLRRAPRLTLSEAVPLATRLARAVAALHRSGIIHRDIKPDNIILLADGGLRLVDLGVARLPRLDDFPSADVPGTPSYMAPELFNGAQGDELTDLYALGVTLYRALSGAFPYGEIEPFSHPRFGKPQPLAARRPDLPAWLDAVLAKAIAVDRASRHGDVIEFAFEIENGAARAQPLAVRKEALYDRNPLLFWKWVSGLLLILLVLALGHR